MKARRRAGAAGSRAGADAAARAEGEQAVRAAERRFARSPAGRLLLPMPGREGALLEWLRGRLWGGGFLLGDDAAAMPLHGDWALTVDSQIAGTHFPPDLDPAVVARRLVAVNRSDLAAMGAGSYALGLLALSAPAGFDHRRFLRGFAAASHEHAVLLVGGDLARAPVLTASLTLLAQRTRGGRWLRRENGRPGDGLWVGGTLGESALGRLLLARGATVRAGADGALSARRVELPARLARRLGAVETRAARAAVLRHLAPEPQRELAPQLAQRHRRCACLDVSDGLALDLARLCAASGTGATIELDRVPVAAGTPELARALGEEVLDLALRGGEDYVLLFALPRRAAAPEGCTRIGTLDEEPGLRVRWEGVAPRPLAAAGWDHLAS